MSAEIYAQKALNQIPRLLGNQDRSPFSPTYGCFHRDYWLDKTSDFPDAVRQFAVQALAIIYCHEFPGNVYYHQPKIRDWAIAAMEFWARIQHREGSFDEFYPYERGWVGPTAFTTFAVVEAYSLLQAEIPEPSARRIREAIRRAAYFIARGEAEEDHLANHHAMACLAVWKVYQLLGEEKLKRAYRQLWANFKSYHNSEEGWSREYDGVDPGYLSATISFLGKIYQTNHDPELLEVLRQSVMFSSYFVYPNGFYAGSMGSRNTLHFYPHGYEILGEEIPLAAAIAEKMLVALGQDKLVPPEIISDRYIVYRVPEYLQAYLDYHQRPDQLPSLPYEQEPFTRYFPAARIFVSNDSRHYLIANLAKGGVLKVFDRESGQLITNDCGLIGQTDDGHILSSQWIDPAYQIQVSDDGWEVSGQFHTVPSNKLFTPLKHIVFRGALITMGWNPRLAHWLKGRIRRTLILETGAAQAHFSRRLQLDEMSLTDRIWIEGKSKFKSLAIGDEFFVRYVPQSRYFQLQELDVHGMSLDSAQLKYLNDQKQIEVEQQLLRQTQPKIGDVPKSLPLGVYDVDYYEGRQRKRQLIYRLQRRTFEVDRALRLYGRGEIRTVIDVGTADALMLGKLRKQWPSVSFLGIDYSSALLRTTRLPDIHKAQADALALPVRTGAADVVVATAVIEHVPDPDQMVRECARILRPGGLLILTTPDPMMDCIASAIGLLKESGHEYTFNLRQLQEIARRHDFQVLEAKKFMFSPVGFPKELMIERVFGPLGLKYVMANQLIVAVRK